MAELKTKQNDLNVTEFIISVADTEQKRNDSFELLKIMSDLTGCEAKMWGSSIIGFGSYHYKSERSKQEGDWPLIGFSPRKAAISLYIFTGAAEHTYLLDGFGKFKTGKACMYIKKLSDINIDVLKNIANTTISFIKNKYK